MFEPIKSSEDVCLLLLVDELISPCWSQGFIHPCDKAGELGYTCMH